MSTLSAAPISVGLLRGLENSKSRSFQIYGEAAATNYNDFDLESEPLSHTLSGPQTCCPPSMDYCDSSSSCATVTPSSYKSTSPSVLVTPPQTPLGLHPTSFPAVPSPLCLGPSLCRTHPENDLEDVCLDGPCDDENNVGEDDELPELVTPQISCSSGMDYCHSISSCSTVTTSSLSTSPSILVTPPQTPLGLHPTSFPAVPSPLCLGPSLCRTHPENDLEDVCLDKSWDDENIVGKEDELLELFTPQPSCSPSMDHCDSSSSCATVTPSSCTSTSPSILVTPPQTPLGLHPTSFPAVPSPLCLGPSLCRTHPENDLEDVCLDGPCDEENTVGKDEGFLELVTPLSSSIPPPSQYLNVGGAVDNHDHERELSSARSCAMTKRVRFLC